MQTFTVQQQSTTVPEITSGTEAAIVATILTTTLIIALFIGILFIIAWWKIFKKAGFAGWKSLIPFYNQYCLFRISGMSGWWILVFIAASLFSSFGYTTTQSGDMITYQVNPMFYVGIIFMIISVIVEIVQLVKLAAAFKKGVGFKIASIFFPNITCLILAFGKAKYNKKYLHD